ncbi:hypothetical protein HMPREF1221_00512 [Treponema socranskii subsp. paredis ATCC 35535]|nr:hypothetical protein HMPREF1221_00512 [Treponema socranskii subsp. paredis ATCC 35535]
MPVILVSPLILIIALSVGIIVATRLFNQQPRRERRGMLFS